jgi:hypothetical protein
MRPSAVTHATDMDQRSVALAFARDGGLLRVTSPPDASVAPPGYYMMFALDSAGIPSVARWIRVHADAPRPADPTEAVAASPGPAAAAPPPGWPVAPAAAVPDRVAPGLLVRAPRVRVRGRRVLVTVRVTVGKRALVRGRLRGVPGRRGARVAAAPVSRRRLAPARPAALTMRALVRPARGARTARLVVTATDAAGNVSAVRRTVRVPAVWAPAGTRRGRGGARS